MKSPSMKLSIVVMAIVTAAGAQSALAQTDAQKVDPHAAMNQKSDATQSVTKTEAQKAFEAVKKLAGNWEGPVSNVAGENDVEGKTAKVTLRETSMGNAFLHEMK